MLRLSFLAGLFGSVSLTGTNRQTCSVGPSDPDGEHDFGGAQAPSKQHPGMGKAFLDKHPQGLASDGSRRGDTGGDTKLSTLVPHPDFRMDT